VSARPRVGISRCLLGDAVRYDGGHKLETSLVHALGAHVEWVVVCPEVEVGMGVPREPVRLVARGDPVPRPHQHVSLIGVQSGEDWTIRMHDWSRRRLGQLASEQLSGFVLKARSPSCGVRGVAIHGTADEGAGLFAHALLSAMPDLPVEDEERLRDPALFESFLNRVRAHHANLSNRTL
jgi:uncharacterized protein YbbK (DUF523 family)